MNKIIYSALLFVPLFAIAQFSSSGTVKQIDVIKNNTQVDIVLDPVSAVKVNSLSGNFALQSGALKELEESAVTSTELGYVSGVTSALQTQINGKQDALPLSVDGDLLYYNAGFASLPIGTAGQVLTVTGGLLPEWADIIAVSVTTKGDIQTYSTTPDRLPVGTNGQVLSSNSATSTGLEWINFSATPTTTLGDIIFRGVSEDERLGIGFENQVLTSKSGIPSWENAPSSGGINFIGNAGIEIDATGYSVFDDAAFPPVDGTGGTTSVLVARSTTSGTYTPLRETASLLFTKTSGANYTGEGFSYDFTVDKGIQGNLLTGKFQVLANDTDCVDDALKITVYDITNTQMLRVTGEGIKCSTLPQTHYFQFAPASDSTSYRLVFTYDSTDTNEVLYYFDDISVSPTRVAKGALITKWKLTTLTTTDSGSVSSQQIYKRRVGDTVEYKGRVVFSGALTTNFIVTLDETPDTEDAPDEISGHAVYDDNGGNVNSGNTKLLTSGTTALFYFPRLDSTNNNWFALGGTYPKTIVSGDEVRFEIDYKVDGWASSGTLSEDLGNREIFIQATGSNTNLTGDTEIVFTNTLEGSSFFDGTTFTVPESAIYTYCFGIETDATIGTGLIIGRLYADGVEDSDVRFFDHRAKMNNNTASNRKTGSGCVIRKSTANEEITFYVNDQDNGGLNEARLQIVKHSPSQSFFQEQAEICQTKFLSADVTTDTDPIGDLTFNNLKVGRCYSIKHKAAIVANTNDAVFTRSSHDGVIITSVALDNPSGTTDSSGIRAADLSHFKATTTTLTFDSTSVGAGSSIQGNGTFNETNATLCEKPATFVCDSNKFD